MNILVTGANGFIGSNLCITLRRQTGLELHLIDIDNAKQEFELLLGKVDFIFHLAGVNRPKAESEFYDANTHLTEWMCTKLIRIGRTPKIVFASSIQAEIDNPYGQSKLLAEQALEQYSQTSGGSVVVYRFKNLFGKLCRPNYNSVTATFCHNIARDLPIEISDPSRTISLTYIDDVVDAFTAELESNTCGFRRAEPLPSTDITLGELAGSLRSFRAHRTSLQLPDFSNRFTRSLYATYLSYLEPTDFPYSLTKREDARGSLAEFVKQSSFGQIFVSRTRPGVTRGNHYHSTKTEKFLVVEGEAVIRFRHVINGSVVAFSVTGKDFRVVDIPPGYTHSIENVGSGELVTLFWSSEVFNQDYPDTYAQPVLK